MVSQNSKDFQRRFDVEQQQKEQATRLEFVCLFAKNRCSRNRIAGGYRRGSIGFGYPPPLPCHSCHSKLFNSQICRRALRRIYSRSLSHFVDLCVSKCGVVGRGCRWRLDSRKVCGNQKLCGLAKTKPSWLKRLANSRDSNSSFLGRLGSFTT